MPTDRDTEERQVSGLMARAVVGYVHRAAGREVAQLVLERADLVGRLPDEMRIGEWFTAEEVLRLAAEAGALCGIADLGRLTGVEQVLGLLEFGALDYFVATGSIRAATELSLSAGMKMTMGRSFEIADAGESFLVIESDILAPELKHQFFCDYAMGVLVTLPTVFGMIGRGAEETCQLRGDDLCRFRITWTEDFRLGTSSLDEQASTARTQERIAWFENLQTVASDLLGTENIDEVLERITHGASTALEAPRFLLAVRVGETERVRVHHRGFADEETAAAHAELLLGGATELPDESVLVTSVAAGDRSLGVLAALSVAKAEFSEREQRTLSSYAGLAAVALQMVATLDGAQRDRDKAQALLSLASDLAAARTTEEVTQCLAAAIPAITRCDIALLWGWDEASESLHLEAWVDLAGGEWTGPRELAVADYPEIKWLAVQRDPLLLRAQAASEIIRWIFDAFALERMATVPIVAGDSFLGLLTTGYRQTILDDDVPQLLAGLVGFADNAAIALENAKLLADIHHQALHDTLTDLPNRPLVEDRARQALAASERSGEPVSLLFIDLDRFKNVNDTLGHGAGDDLIRQVATRLRPLLRSIDTLARLGGDEFLALLPGIDTIGAVEVGNRIVDALHQPFELRDREVYISCSIGVACTPYHGRDYEELMAHADAAMYQAKAQGRNTLALHSAPATGRRREQLDLETALHRAIEEGQLRVLYQPEVVSATGQLVGLEALARWEHPELGLIEPDDFIHLAEDSGLIVEVGTFVRRTALEQVATWARGGLTLRIALNLSNRDLQIPDIAKTIALEIAAAGVDPSLVELEITDRVVMADGELAAVLNSLHDIGVRLALDDFGTGSSVLDQLQRCPFSTLKIARSFVHGVVAGSPEALVLRALVALGQSLELQVLAEGVEVAEENDLLVQCGCDLSQGFLFGHPMTADEVDELYSPSVDLDATQRI